MVELARSLEGKMDVRDVRGLALRHDGGIVRTPPRPLEDDLDRLPVPARDLVPLARYLAFDSHASVVTSRGCPYECVFCSAPAWTGRSVRYRTPSLCVDEIEDLAAHGLHRDHDRGRSLHALPQALHGGLRRAGAPRHRHPLERLLARRHHLARDRRDDGARRLPGHLLWRRERQPGSTRPGQEALEPRQGEGSHAHDAGRRHQRAGLLHHRAAGRDRGDAAQDRRVRERAAPGVRVPVRLPHPGALPRHRGARQGQGVRPRDPQQTTGRNTTPTTW